MIPRKTIGQSLVRLALDRLFATEKTVTSGSRFQWTCPIIELGSCQSYPMRADTNITIENAVRLSGLLLRGDFMISLVHYLLHSLLIRKVGVDFVGLRSQT